MKQIAVKAQLREKKGKSWAKKLRVKKLIPCICYGPGKENMMLAVELSEIHRIIKTTKEVNIFIELNIERDGKGKEKRLVLLKDLQQNPITDEILHVDFYELSVDREISVDVPIRLVNTPVGVKKGGVLQQIVRELGITCLPKYLMDHIEADVSQLEIGDALHIKDLEIPKEIKIDEDPEQAVAVVTSPEAAEEEEKEAEEQAEEKKEKVNL